LTYAIQYIASMELLFLMCKFFDSLFLELENILKICRCFASINYPLRYNIFSVQHFYWWQNKGRKYAN